MLKPSGFWSALGGIASGVSACEAHREEVSPVTSIYISLLYCLSSNKSRVESTRGGVNMEVTGSSARGLAALLCGVASARVCGAQCAHRAARAPPGGRGAGPVARAQNFD